VRGGRIDPEFTLKSLLTVLRGRQGDMEIGMN
jgi:hypothetical protein